MNTHLWKLNEEKLNKTNLFLYSSFIKENFKIDAEKDFNKKSKLLGKRLHTPYKKLEQAFKIKHTK